jgi:hypothetical protein
MPWKTGGDQVEWKLAMRMPPAQTRRERDGRAQTMRRAQPMHETVGLESRAVMWFGGRRS